MTRRTAFDLERRVFENERTLLIGVTFHASRIRADGEFGLFVFKTAVRVVTITAFHRAFQNAVAKRFAELRFDFAVTTDAKLRLARFEHCGRGDFGFLARNLA